MEPAKFTFNKKGLEPKEFEDCLNSKVNELFKDSNTGIKTLMKKRVEDVRKEVCIRVNKTNNKIDNRSPKAERNMRKNNLKAATPEQDRQGTSGTQGIQRSDRRNTKRYHDEQHLLFSRVLIPKFTDVFDQISLKEVNKLKGYFFWRGNDQKLTTEEFCYVIDQITTEYIKYFFQLKDNTVNRAELNRAELQDVYDSCLSILLGRVAVDWSTENDLMSAGGYDVWKKHVLVEMSYAALAVVVVMILSEPWKSRKPGRKPTADREPMVNTGINDYFAPLAVTVIGVIGIMAAIIYRKR